MWHASTRTHPEVNPKRCTESESVVHIGQATPNHDMWDQASNSSLRDQLGIPGGSERTEVEFVARHLSLV